MIDQKPDPRDEERARGVVATCTHPGWAGQNCDLPVACEPCIRAALTEARREDALTIEHLRRELDAAKREVEDYDELTTRQSKLLTGVVNAIKGEPPELVSWSHHDAPELAEALRRERDETQAEVERLTYAWFVDEGIQSDGSLRPSVNSTIERAAAAEREVERLRQVAMLHQDQENELRRERDEALDDIAEVGKERFTAEVRAERLRAVLGQLVEAAYKVRPGVVPELEAALAEADPLLKKKGS